MKKEENMVIINHISNIPVLFDGNVSKYEYLDAEKCVINGPQGEIEIFLKITDGYLCFASQLPNSHYYIGHDLVIMLEPKNECGKTPSINAIRAYIRRKIEHSIQHKGMGWADWKGEWEFKSVNYNTGWEIECRIPLEELQIDVSNRVEMGLAFRSYDDEPLGKWNWPEGSDENVPETWGKLVIEMI